MPFPAGTTVVTLTGTLPAAVAGTGFGGQVVLTPSALLTDSARHAVYPGGGQVDIIDGAFTAQIIPNNATGIAPEGWRWYVDVQPLKGRRTAFWADIHGANGDTIHLDDLVPAQAPGGGTTGTPGKSAYEIAVEEGFSGTVTQWLASLVGQQGPQGNPGPKGDQGDPGPAGADGSNADAEAYTDAAITTHDQATDPHGDRAWADNKFATSTALGALNTTVVNLSGSVSNLDGFVQDCLTRVSNIEQGTAWLNGVNSTGLVQIVGANLLVKRGDGTGAYRFRTTGGGLDLEVGGMDCIVSHWSNPDFSGTQKAMMRWEPAGPHLIGRVQVGTSPYDTVFDMDAAGGKLGFFGIAAVTRQAITGSRSDGTAFANLLAALDAYGIIDDQTTA